MERKVGVIQPNLHCNSSIKLEESKYLTKVTNKNSEHPSFKIIGSELIQK